jgi:prolyl-tRNA editing enzyme YbaK/EbsC (Cys-tRNA(Pro) deacylase)
VNASHPAVDAVESALRAAGVEPRTTWFDAATNTAPEAAAKLGVEVAAIANSLVFTLDGRPILVMASGGHRVDTEYLGELLGGTIARASASEVKAATGQVIGGVAPLGHPRPLPTYVDVDLARSPELWAAAGHPHTVFPTTFDELVRITSGTPTRVVREEEGDPTC